VRVLHLISGLGGGGLERWLWDVVRLSSPADVEHRVVVIYPDLGVGTGYGDALSARGALGGGAPGPVSRLAAPLLRRMRNRPPRRSLLRALSLPLRAGAAGLASARVMKEILRFRPDVVHSHSAADVLLGIGLRMAFGKPLVHTVPCLFSQMVDADVPWLPRVYGRFHRWIDRFSTGEARAELLAVGVPESKILYDLGGADLEALDRALAERARHREEVRRGLGLPGDALIALSVGRLHPSKGHGYALEALPRLLRAFPDLHWLVLGEGAELPALEARARVLGVAAHVHLAGYRPDPFPYFAAGDVYLRTPVFEPENLSFYQSMAAGLPAAGFDTGWPDLIARVGHGHLVPNRDPDALAAAVESILSDPVRAREMGERARAYALRNLDVRQSVALLTRCYLGLAAGPARPPDEPP
jgi:glycosyltransferase involved in cell wall biosynthesis